MSNPKEILEGFRIPVTMDDPKMQSVVKEVERRQMGEATELEINMMLDGMRELLNLGGQVGVLGAFHTWMKDIVEFMVKNGPTKQGEIAERTRIGLTLISQAAECFTGIITHIEPDPNKTKH